jgi:hypothetical protein
MSRLNAVAFQAEAEVLLSHISCRLQEILSQNVKPGDAHLHRALMLAYHELTDQQKIVFLLAGGAPQLFQYLQKQWLPNQTGAMDTGFSDLETGSLPVLC